jgi:trimeric autotransporter adhesin
MKKNIFVVALAFLYINANAQNVGIGTTMPKARLHVTDSSVAFSATGSISNTPGNPPLSGNGRRMMWYADKAAFRVGYALSTNWDKDSIGSYSMATGYNTKAKGSYSTAMGSGSTATGSNSTAMGRDAAATGNTSTAMGWFPKASGSYATAMGHITDASGTYSTAIGSYTNATGENSTALGSNTTAEGESSTTMGYNTKAVGSFSIATGNNTLANRYASTAIGYFTTAGGSYSTAIGNNTKSNGDNSTAMGLFTNSSPFASLAIGQYNDTAINSSKTIWQANDPLFIIGNGTADNARRNAFTVLKNGNTGINITSPLAMLHVADSNVVFSAVGLVIAPYGNPPISGAGRRMMWYADKAAFRAGYVIDDKWDKDSIGRYSFAANYNNMAKGDYTFSANSNNQALRSSSTAIGQDNIANGTTSTVMGRGNIAHTSNGLVIGQYNDTVIAVNNFGLAEPNHPLFIIGNGTLSNVRKNALVVNKNGSMGIGTNYPLARLHVVDSNVVFSAEGDIQPGISPGINPLRVNGEGRRMIWYANLAAFRVGYVSSTQWDKDSIGDYSFAAGYNNKAKGFYSTAMGRSTTSSGTNSIAIGQSTTASGTTSTAMGQSTIASGNTSIAMGQGTISSGTNSSAMGKSTIASGNFSTALGENSIASGTTSTALGFSNTASGIYTTALGSSNTVSGASATAMGGSNISSGDYSSALGRFNKSKSYAGVVIGIYNDSANALNANAADDNNRLFQIGNGVSDFSRKNAMTVLLNGQTGFNTSTPEAVIDVNGSVAMRQNSVTVNNGVNNDVTPGEYSFIKITSPTAAFSISGFTSGVDGKILTVLNLTGQNMTITSQTTSASSAANRINTLSGTDIVTVGNGSVTMQYSASDNRWMVIAVRD